jgi:two-component system, cell cycle sensor histidine kinase and response regulator CckA
VIEGLNSGADNFITKPYDDRYLLARIDYLLANRALRGSSKLAAGLQIEIGGKTHLITAEREQILDLLMSVYGEAARFSEEARAREASLRELYQTLEILYRSEEALNRARGTAEVTAAALDMCLALGSVEDAHIVLADAAGNLPEGSAGRAQTIVPLVSGAARVGTLMLDRKDGGSMPETELFSIFGSQVGAALDRAKHYEGVARDAAERTQQLDKLAANFPGLVYRRVRTPDGKISHPFAAGRMLGELELPAGQEIDLLGLVRPEDVGPFVEAMEESAKTLSPAVIEFGISLPSGLTRRIESRSQPSPQPDGSVVWDGVAFDVTHVHEARRRETQLKNQLVQAQKMEAIGNLTGGMAHDFNNLLGVVIGNLDLLRERIGEDAESAELAGEALDAALRGADLTRRLLAFARRQPLQPKRIDVNELVTSIVTLLRRLLGEDIEVSLALGEGTWPIVADPAQLEAAIANLATNARDAMPKGGRLRIVTANRQLDHDYASMHAELVPGDYAMVEVSDTGTGMPPEVVARIFEPFFTTKEQGKGTGLGLSMVFGFMKQSGGHINVYSEAGIGTTFRLYLPRAAAAKPQESTAEAEALPRGHGEAVLVVEDNPALRKVAVRQLAELGYRTFEAENAAAALDLLARESVDLLFSDVVLPGGLDGIEMARLAQDRRPGLRAVLTSGFPGNPGERGDLTFRLLTKPYRKMDLARTLDAALTGG